jgi:hypothetical protein
MVTDRLLEDTDLPLLRTSLANDEYHSDTPAEFFQQEGTVTKVYETEDHTPICFARVTKSMRIDVQFVDNDDHSRNGAAMFEGLKALAPAAKSNGFTELVFTTNVSALANFARDVLGYDIVPDTFVLRKQL